MPPPRVYGGPGPSLQKQPQQTQEHQPPQPPLQPQQPAAIPSPVKETKPDIAIATTVPAPTKPAPIQPTAKPASIVPAMPIPISIPVQPRATKSSPQLQTPPPPPAQPTTTSPETATQPSITDTTNVATAIDVQSLAKNLSETKLSSNIPGAGTYLTQPRRRQYANQQPRKMDEDYDFESANAKFNKEEVAKEVAAQAGVPNASADPSQSSSGPSAAQLSAALAASETFYDRGKSFFDNISCENKDRSGEDGNPTSWKRGEERRLNIETFGQASVDYGSARYGRGGGRGGRGGYRGGRGGGRGRGGNPWRGRAGAATNGQRSSETTTTTA